MSSATRRASDLLPRRRFQGAVRRPSPEICCDQHTDPCTADDHHPKQPLWRSDQHRHGCRSNGLAFSKQHKSLAGGSRRESGHEHRRRSGAADRCTRNPKAHYRDHGRASAKRWSIGRSPMTRSATTWPPAKTASHAGLMRNHAISDACAAAPDRRGPCPQSLIQGRHAMAPSRRDRIRSSAPPSTSLDRSENLHRNLPPLPAETAHCALAAFQPLRRSTGPAGWKPSVWPVSAGSIKDRCARMPE